ncbi:hypothetical protein C923_05405 [Plasmodium falciparum UGT5.1]|uniref:Uncharacterized protein n=1 Tax=Plasmodium falciparum UGT5.1 TaxID=1237627 RepID=W7JQX0_PLAFA|nr:hypothetical protein C923_05405 [Plasmodium falciparum UGT5.1]
MKFLKLFKIEWKYEIQIIIINDIYIYLIIFGHAKLTICPYYHFHNKREKEKNKKCNEHHFKTLKGMIP